jgi:hypothetical protein
MQFLSLIDANASLSELAAAADALSADERRALVKRIKWRQLRQLYALAAPLEKTPWADLTFFVPDSLGSDEAVTFFGANNVPIFSTFLKRFTRSSQRGVLLGHNVNAGWVDALIGPGYFTVSRSEGVPNEFLFDYSRIPSEPPTGWPTPRNNNAFPQSPVFGHLQDRVRTVGKHLAVGEVYRRGKPAGQRFLLARGPSRNRSSSVTK